MRDFGAQIAPLIPRLRRYARALTGERMLSDDLVQDTLERAWTKLHLWRPDSDLRAWLFTIMHNVFVNQVRRRARDATLPLDGDALEISASVTGRDALDVRDVDAALRRLPDEQREVLLLIGLEQLSYSETASVLEVPVGTVMSRLSRAREKMRVLLDGAPSTTPLKVVK